MDYSMDTGDGVSSDRLENLTCYRPRSTVHRPFLPSAVRGLYDEPRSHTVNEFLTNKRMRTPLG